MLEPLDLVDPMLESVTQGPAGTCRNCPRTNRSNRSKKVFTYFICYDLFLIWDVIQQREVGQVLDSFFRERSSMKLLRVVGDA